jgi:DNA transformation protein
MSLSPGFADYAMELLSGFAPLEIKRMFGGAGIYRNQLMFAILDDDAIYFRTDAALAADLKAQGSEVWVYSMKRDGVARDMGYWRMPETAADDPEEAVAIARRAYAAALKRKELKGNPKARKPKAVSPKLTNVAKKARTRSGSTTPTALKK